MQAWEWMTEFLCEIVLDGFYFLKPDLGQHPNIPIWIGQPKLSAPDQGSEKAYHVLYWEECTGAPPEKYIDGKFTRNRFDKKKRCAFLRLVYADSYQQLSDHTST